MEGDNDKSGIRLYKIFNVVYHPVFLFVFAAWFSYAHGTLLTVLLATLTVVSLGLSFAVGPSMLGVGGGLALWHIRFAALSGAFCATLSIAGFYPDEFTAFSLAVLVVALNASVLARRSIWPRLHKPT